MGKRPYSIPPECVIAGREFRSFLRRVKAIDDGATDQFDKIMYHGFWLDFAKRVGCDQRSLGNWRRGGNVSKQFVKPLRRAMTVIMRREKLDFDQFD